MACAHPILIKNPYYKNALHGTSKYFANSASWKEYIQVPCGWCLNCRIDKRNALEDRCNYEYLLNGKGAFVTLTYDDDSVKHLVRQDALGRPILSLCRDDYRNFIKRLRSKIHYNNLYKTGYVDKTFKYLVVGEYGGQFKRPHFHVLFFGLDYAHCDKLIQDCWQHGITDCGQIKQGGIRYVLKYLDKQIHSEDAKIAYDYNNIERPFSFHSINLGVGLYKDNIDFIKNNNYCYKTKHNKLRPIPAYYRNKLFGHYIPDTMAIVDKMKNINIKPDRFGKYSLMARNAYRHNLALQREQQLIQSMRSDGVACYDYCSNVPNDFDYGTVEVALYGDKVPF